MALGLSGLSESAAHVKTQKVVLTTKRSPAFKILLYLKYVSKEGKEEEQETAKKTDCELELMAIPLPCLSL